MLVVLSVDMWVLDYLVPLFFSSCLWLGYLRHRPHGRTRWDSGVSIFGSIAGTDRSIAQQLPVPRNAQGQDRTATQQATVPRTDHLRAEALETVRLVHAAVDTLDPTAILNHDRAL